MHDKRKIRLRPIVCAAAAAITAALLLGAASPPQARALTSAKCCLRVTIDANGWFIVNYGDEASVRSQRGGRAGQYTISWSYHVRGLAKYLDSSKPMIFYVWKSGHAAAVYSADLNELADVKILTPNGSYDEWTNSNDCTKPVQAYGIKINYTPSPQGWGNSLIGPAFGRDKFWPNCGDETAASDVGLFGAPYSGTLFGSYLGYVFPFPSAHRAQLRKGTMHASTICTDWRKQTPGQNGRYWSFDGYMTVETTLDSFPASELKSNGQRLTKLIGKEGVAAKNFNGDPFNMGGNDGNLKPTGKPGCHPPRP